MPPTQHHHRARTDLLIVGGGLAGGLLALALRRERPELSVAIVEPGAVGGNHLWSFFESDVAPDDRWLVEPLICHRWPAYDVAFPHHARTVAEPYHSIESEALDRAVRAALPPGAIVAAGAAEVAARHVRLRDGRVLEAGAVVDARGAGDLATLDLGWQKFVGRLLAVEGGHGVARPVVMDATVTQRDGYRFVYLLPFDESHVFVEDTYYSDDPTIDRNAIAARIDAYAARRGWRVTAATREEQGVLPVVVGGRFNDYWCSTGGNVAKIGVRAGSFQPTTGYSLPDAVRCAVRLARLPDLSGEKLARWTHDYAQGVWRRRGFYRMLDTLLFRAAEPGERYRVMERFYRLRPALIGRFYAGRSTLADKARILSGRPPVPVGRAIGALMGLRA